MNTKDLLNVRGYWDSTEQCRIAEELETAQQRIAELERESEYNFNLYQEAGEQLCKQADRIAELEAIIAEAGKQKPASSKFIMSKDGNRIVNFYAHPDYASAARIKELEAEVERLKSGSVRTWIVLNRPGYSTERKGPLVDTKHTEQMLRELYDTYPDCICTVLDFEVTEYPEDGREWLSIYGDGRRKKPAKAPNYKDEITALREKLRVAREAWQTFMDSHEECTDFDGFTSQIVSMDDYHTAQEALATIGDE